MILNDVLTGKGKECLSFLLFNDTDTYSKMELKTLFLQELFIRGVLGIGPII